MDFDALPPEINSGRIYTGPGARPLVEAAHAWNTLSTDLFSTVAASTSAITSLATTWQGSAATAMQTAAQLYLDWLESTAVQAQLTAEQARSAASAYEAAFIATVPPGVVAANRSLLLHLIATNLLGQNTPAIAATEAQYTEMWAQDAAAMNTYAASSSAATAGLPQFTPAAQTTNPAGTAAQSAAVTTAAAIGSGGWLDNSTTSGQLIQALISSGFPIDVGQMFVNFIGYNEIAAATEDAGGRSAAAIAAGPPVLAPVPIGPHPEPVPSTPPVTAAAGTGNSIGRLSVPPSWARPPEQRTPQVSVDSPTRDRYQAAIPAVPFMPVASSAGRSAQGRVREDPEYGHVSKIIPPRHPAGG